MAKQIQKSDTIDLILGELKGRGFPVRWKEVRDAIEMMDYIIQKSDTAPYFKIVDTTDPARVVDLPKLVQGVGGYLLMNHPDDFKPVDPEHVVDILSDGKTLPVDGDNNVHVDPVVVKEYNTRLRKETQSRLDLDIEADDLAVIRATLDDYLQQVDQHFPEMRLPGKDMPVLRQEYLNHLFAAPMDNWGSSVIKHYVTTVERLLPQGEDVACAFAQSARTLYSWLSPEGVEEFISHAETARDGIKSHVALLNSEANSKFRELIAAEHGKMIPLYREVRNRLELVKKDLDAARIKKELADEQVKYLQTSLTHQSNVAEKYDVLLNKETKRKDNWRWIAIGASALSLILGFGFGYSSAPSSTKDAQKLRNQVSQLQRERDDFNQANINCEDEFFNLQDDYGQLQRDLAIPKTYPVLCQDAVAASIHDNLNSLSGLYTILEQGIVARGGEIVVKGPGRDAALRDVYHILTGNSGKKDDENKFTAIMKGGPVFEGVKDGDAYARLRIK